VKERGAGRACDVCACVGACECLCERARKRDGAAADSGIRARQEDCKASPPSRASPVNQVPYFEARTRGREEEEVGSLPSPAFSEPTYTSTHARPRACTCAPVRRSLTVRSLSSLALFRHSRCFVTRAVSLDAACARHARLEALGLIEELMASGRPSCLGTDLIRAFYRRGATAHAPTLPSPLPRAPTLFCVRPVCLQDAPRPITTPHATPIPQLPPATLYPTRGHLDRPRHRTDVACALSPQSLP